MSPISGLTNASTTPPAGSGSGSTATGSTEVNKNMFLQLLVAQLRNQDPLNPADGTQFITQLAQFQQLEQSMNTGEEIAAMRQDLDQLVAASAPTSTK